MKENRLSEDIQLWCIICGLVFLFAFKELGMWIVVKFRKTIKTKNHAPAPVQVIQYTMYHPFHSHQQSRKGSSSRNHRVHLNMLYHVL